jgi:hypothetical protein
MIARIGARRTFVLIGLVSVLALLFFMTEYVLKPNAMKSEQKLNVMRGELSTLQTEVQKMQADFVLFEKQKEFFNTISKMGFFNDQNRVLARERFDTMQKLSKITSAKYEIRAANLLTQESPPETGFVVMESPISVSLSAVDDLDVYRFIHYLNYGFPGHITISSINLTRNIDVTPEILKQIGSGTPPEIISAKLELDWRTMARTQDITPQSNNDPAATTPPVTEGAPQ